MASRKPIPVVIADEIRESAKSSALLSYGIATMKPDEQRQLLSLLRKARENAEGGEEAESTATKPKPGKRVSAIVTIMKNIRENLDAYEKDNDNVFDIQIDLGFIFDNIAKDLSQETDQNIVVVFKKYETEGKKSNFISLLICFAKGESSQYILFTQNHISSFFFCRKSIPGVQTQEPRILLG